MIRVVTDSSSQLSAAEADQHSITVVPIVITLDGEEYREGIDLTADEFYSMLTDGVSISTSQPSPGTFLDTYRRLIENGATEIVSVHVSESASGTLNSARIAAAEVDVPVTLVDSTMTSYGLAVIALDLGQLVADTGSTDRVAARAAQLIPAISMVFILQDLRYILRGGRMRQPELPAGADDIPVLGGSGGSYELVGTGRTIDDLVDRMAASLLAGESRRHAAIAHAAPDTIEFTEALETRMKASDKVASVTRYRMGPSIAVHTGPGTAGGFVWPA